MEGVSQHCLCGFSHAAGDKPHLLRRKWAMLWENKLSLPGLGRGLGKDEGWESEVQPHPLYILCLSWKMRSPENSILTRDWSRFKTSSLTCPTLNTPSATWTRRTAPCQRLNQESNRRILKGASNPKVLGGGTPSTTLSSKSATPIPSLAEIAVTSSGSTSNMVKSCSFTASGSAPGRSILLMTGRIERSFANARKKLETVCAWINTVLAFFSPY